MIMTALKEGRLFIANDMVKPSRGFKFFLDNAGNITSMGESIDYKTGQKIIAKLPYPAQCRLFCNGVLLDQKKVESEVSWEVKEAGAYRLECTRRFLGKERGWIFSNPIYINPSP